jgi:hypothetical protein
MSIKPYLLPPELDREARKIARRDGVPLERFIATAVSAMIGADRAFHASKRMNKEYAKKRFLEILDKAPDVPPMPGDEIPPELAAKLKRLRARPNSAEK